MEEMCLELTFGQSRLCVVMNAVYATNFHVRYFRASRAGRRLAAWLTGTIIVTVFLLGVTLLLPPLFTSSHYWIFFAAAALLLFQILLNFIGAASERHGKTSHLSACSFANYTLRVSLPSRLRNPRLTWCTPPSSC